jgi:hypothetical protein
VIPERPGPAGTAEAAGQIEHAYPGYRVWISDEGGGTRPGRVPGRAASRRPCIDRAGELTRALATEEAAAGGHAMAAAW